MIRVKQQNHLNIPFQKILKNRARTGFRMLENKKNIRCPVSPGVLWGAMGRGLPESPKRGSEITGDYPEIPTEAEIPGNMGKRYRDGLRCG